MTSSKCPATGCKRMWMMSIEHKRTEKGRTPLHHAAAATEPRLVYELIKSGADVHMKDHSNFTALDVALHVQVPLCADTSYLVA